MNFETNQIISLHDKDWFERQSVAGRCVGGILSTLNRMVSEKTPNLSLLDMEAEAVRQLKAADCTATFKDYKGFPGSVCLSVNKALVHGIPSDYVLRDGDVVKFDLGATYRGAIADAAATAIYGEAKDKRHTEMIAMCRGALNHAIANIKIGKQLGSIGYAIHRYVTSKSNFGLVTSYGGHGIDELRPHAPPFVANRAKFNEGPRIVAGMALAIEPMLCIGQPDTKVDKDGWTVLTKDIGVHEEHSIFVGEDKVYVMTEWM